MSHFLKNRHKRSSFAGSPGNPDDETHHDEVLQELDKVVQHEFNQYNVLSLDNRHRKRLSYPMRAPVSPLESTYPMTKSRAEPYQVIGTDPRTRMQVELNRLQTENDHFAEMLQEKGEEILRLQNQLDMFNNQGHQDVQTMMNTMAERLQTKERAVQDLQGQLKLAEAKIAELMKLEPELDTALQRLEETELLLRERPLQLEDIDAQHALAEMTTTSLKAELEAALRQLQAKEKALWDLERRFQTAEIEHSLQQGEAQAAKLQEAAVSPKPLQDLKARLQEAGAERSELQAQLVAKEAQLGTLQIRFDHEVAEKEQLHQALSKLARDSTKMKVDLESRGKEVRQLRADLEAAAAEGQAWQGRAQEAVAAQRAMQVQLEAKENALGQTKRDLQHESASRERLRTELLTRETDVATLKGTCEAKDRTIVDLQREAAEVGPLKMQVGDLEAKLLVAKTQLVARQEATAQAETDLGEAKGQVVRLTAQLETQLREVAHLKGSMAALGSEQQAAGQTLSPKLQRVEAHNADLQARLSELQVRAALLEEKVGHYEREAGQHAAAMGVAQDAIARHEATVRALEGEAAQLKALVEAQGQELADVQREASAAAAKVSELLGAVAAAQARAESLQDVVGREEERRAVLQQELAAATARVRELEEQQQLAALTLVASVLNPPEAPQPVEAAPLPLSPPAEAAPVLAAAVVAAGREEVEPGAGLPVEATPEAALGPPEAGGPSEDTAGAAPQPETAAAACAPGDPAEVAGGDIDEVGDPEEACNDAEAVGAEEEAAAAEDEGEEEEAEADAEAEAAEEQSIAEDEAEALFGGEAEPQPGAEEEEEQPEDAGPQPEAKIYVEDNKGSAGGDGEGEAAEEEEAAEMEEAEEAEEADGSESSRRQPSGTNVAAVHILRDLFRLPPWVPVSLDDGLAHLFCHMIQHVVQHFKSTDSDSPGRAAALGSRRKPLTVETLVDCVRAFLTLPVEDAALLAVFAVPSHIVFRCFQTPGWLARAVVASYNEEVLRTVHVEISDDVRRALEHPENRTLRSLLKDFLIDTINQKPADFFFFANDWLESRSGFVLPHQRRPQLPAVLESPTAGGKMVEPRLTRVMREFLMYLAERGGLEDTYVTMHLPKVGTTSFQKTFYGLSQKRFVLALDWLQNQLNFLPRLDDDGDGQEDCEPPASMGEDLVEHLSSTSRYPFTTSPLLTVLKRLSFHIIHHRSLPAPSPSMMLDAEVILMHDLRMPLASLKVESGNTWLQKVGLFLMERIPSSHPLTGNSEVTGMKTTYNEAKGLIGRMSDEEIYGTFATIVASGYGKAVGADLKHGESKENLYPFIATMIHYLSYSPQMEELFQIVRSRQLSVLQDQLKEMVVEEDKDSTKINEKALFLSMRNQHFLTLLMEASLLGSKDIVRELLDAGAQSNSVIQESTLPYVFEYLVEILQHQQLPLFQCDECGQQVARADREVMLQKGYGAVAVCDRCAAHTNLGKGLNCQNCNWDCCPECILDFLGEGMRREKVVKCPKCRHPTTKRHVERKPSETPQPAATCAPQEKEEEGKDVGEGAKRDEADANEDDDNEEEEASTQDSDSDSDDNPWRTCDACDDVLLEEEGQHCQTCKWEICDSCTLRLAKRVVVPVEKQVLQLLKVLSEHGFEEVLKARFPDVFPDFQRLPEITPLFLHQLQEAVQAKDPALPAMIDVLPDFRWLPWSAHFFAELAGFKDVVKEFRDSKLHDFELDQLKRFRQMRAHWLEGPTCCKRPSSGLKPMGQCFCGFSHIADLFFMTMVRLGEPQPDARTDFVEFISCGLHKTWPDDFSRSYVNLLLARTRIFILLQLLRPNYGEAAGDLSPVNIAVVYLYTLQTPIYQKMNAAFYTRDTAEIANWRPFSEQLMVALNKLPGTCFMDPPFANFSTNIQAASFRGVGPSVDFSKYVEGEPISLENFTSTSLSAYIAHSFGYEGSILITKMKSYKLISRYSDFPTEQEFLAPPGTRFRVRRVYRSPNPKASGVATSVMPLMYFYMACTQCEDWESCGLRGLENENMENMVSERALADTLEAIYTDPVRSFQLTFGHLSYNLVYLEEEDAEA